MLAVEVEVEDEALVIKLVAGSTSDMENIVGSKSADLFASRVYSVITSIFPDLNLNVVFGLSKPSTLFILSLCAQFKDSKEH